MLKKKINEQYFPLYPKLYEPLGWLAPVTITWKLFVKKLWFSENSWDQEL